LADDERTVDGLDKELSPLDNMPPDGLNAAVPDTQVKHEAVTAFADKPQHLSEPNLRRASMNKEGVQCKSVLKDMQ
jgi:hypothetical protein